MLTFSVVATPSNGSLELLADGTFTYTPNHGFVGIDTFDFAANDGAASSTATVTIDVYNTAPVADSASESVLHGQTLYSSVSGSDPDRTKVSGTKNSRCRSRSRSPWSRRPATGRSN